MRLQCMDWSMQQRVSLRMTEADELVGTRERMVEDLGGAMGAADGGWF